MMAFCSFAIVPLEHWEHDVVDAHASVAYSLLGSWHFDGILIFGYGACGEEHWEFELVDAPASVPTNDILAGLINAGGADAPLRAGGPVKRADAAGDVLFRSLASGPSRRFRRAGFRGVAHWQASPTGSHDANLRSFYVLKTEPELQHVFLLFC
eukprot:s1066_g18.t1